MSDRPSDWLVGAIDLMPAARPVLDVASGTGRHALFLARAGWPVHAVDCNPQSLAVLDAAATAEGLPITTEVLDLEGGGPVSLGTACFGTIVVINYLHRPLMPAIVEALEAGGVLIYETFTVGQAERGHPKNPSFLLHPGELPGLVSPLTVMRSREGDVEGKLVASVVAVRR